MLVHRSSSSVIPVREDWFDNVLQELVTGWCTASDQLVIHRREYWAAPQLIKHTIAVLHMKCHWLMWHPGLFSCSWWKFKTTRQTVTNVLIVLSVWFSYITSALYGRSLLSWCARTCRVPPWRAWGMGDYHFHPASSLSGDAETHEYIVPHCSSLVCGTQVCKVSAGIKVTALKLRCTLRWIQIKSLSTWELFNMCTWKMERIYLLAWAVHVLFPESRGLFQNLARSFRLTWCGS